ncbi:MAG: hypothetical protein GWN71_09125, partial [Gammaproteobacteria bacterium]|nr:hypothetical protein [Gemmatimonadota bacterium]NIU73725.1 hypothetical protein [Gammaproteobacteria bacterium]
MAATAGHALELLTLAVDRLDAGAWSAGDVAITLGAPAPGRISARLSGRGLVLPPPLDTLRDVSVDCPLAEVAEASIVCAEATLRATDEDRVPMELPLAMGLERDAGGWRLRLDARELDPAPLWRLAAAGGRLPGIEFAAGGLSVSLVLGPGGAASSANVRARLSGATFSDPSGLHAGEDLDARLDAVVTRAAGGWRATATLATDAGQAYLDPIFVDAAAAPITLAAEADLADGEPARSSVSFRIRHENVADVAGTLSLEDVAIRSLDLEIPSTPMAAV